MSTAGDAPPEIEDRLREICLGLPDVARAFDQPAEVPAWRDGAGPERT